ncbi:MAG: MarR family transcriptional regulator [Spirulinaceae cyanobacterium]
MNNALFDALQQQLQSWFTKAKEVADSQDDLVELPEAMVTQLAAQLEELSAPAPYQTAIQEAIAPRLQAWQSQLDTPNYLVILSSPVEPLHQILPESLARWADRPELNIITPLPCLSRATDPLQLSEQIQDQLAQSAPIQTQKTQPSDASDDLSAADVLAERQTLVIIPCLEQCFLRCIGGWEGIERLRNLMIGNRDCFWVMGCNCWAWEFLDFASQIRAYFSDELTLPDLDSEMLQAWLDPVVRTVVDPQIATEFADLELIDLSHDPSDDDDEDEDEADEQKKQKRRQAYWSALASQSGGVGAIAAQLWLQSLRIQPAEIADEDDPANSLERVQTPDGESDDERAEQREEDAQLTLREIKPTLPHLPSLTHRDRYWLHSVLIHGPITAAHLALSLGESEGQNQSQVQRLVQAGLLVWQKDTLILHASHYAKLKSRLANDNFFVGKD